jgi:hypothetical protein
MSSRKWQNSRNPLKQTESYPVVEATLHTTDDALNPAANWVLELLSLQLTTPSLLEIKFEYLLLHS